VPTALFAAAATDDLWVGRTLVQVLNEETRSGLQIVYSESLVPRHLTLTAACMAV
jgi:hypothetical protein